MTGSGTPFHRIPILFDDWYSVLSSIVGLLPSHSYVLVSHDVIHVRMGWAFRAAFPKSAVASAVIDDRRPISRGVHGFAGRWLVNGSSQGIVLLTLEPAQRCHVVGVPLRLKQLLVSVPQPEEVLSLIRA